MRARAWYALVHVPAGFAFARMHTERARQLRQYRHKRSWRSIETCTRPVQHCACICAQRRARKEVHRAHTHRGVHAQMRTSEGMHSIAHARSHNGEHARRCIAHTHRGVRAQRRRTAQRAWLAGAPPKGRGRERPITRESQPPLGYAFLGLTAQTAHTLHTHTSACAHTQLKACMTQSQSKAPTSAPLVAAVAPPLRSAMLTRLRSRAAWEMPSSAACGRVGMRGGG